MANEITERTVEVDGIRVFLREVGGEGTPTVFVHGNPTNSLDWVPFLERMNGPAIALDLPGWGRSERPDPATFDGSMTALAGIVEGLLDQELPGPYRLVVHDWGGLALIAAQRHPERVERLVMMNCVAFLPGFHWHWIARIWRRRGIGEFFNATNSRWATALMLRQARPGFKPMPKEFVDMIWESFDKGTRHAILALYRSAEVEDLEANGAKLAQLSCPTLIAWGQDDPYTRPQIGVQYAAALPNAELVELENAGHWPWIDRPELVDRVVGFLAS